MFEMCGGMWFKQAYRVLVYSSLFPSAAKIEEQKDQLMQLMQQLQYVESLEKKLANQKEEYKAGIHNLKMEAAVERAK